MGEPAQEMGHSIEIDLDHRRYVERQQLPDEQVRGRYLGQVRAPDLIDLSGEYGRVAVARFADRHHCVEAASVNGIPAWPDREVIVSPKQQCH
jgi:hypothetical protein